MMTKVLVTIEKTVANKVAEKSQILITLYAPNIAW